MHSMTRTSIESLSPSQVPQAGLRVLFLAPKCYPPSGSEALTNAKVATALLRAGVDVDVVCAPPSAKKTYPESRSPIWNVLGKAAHLVPAVPTSKFSKWTNCTLVMLRTGHVHGNVFWILPALKAVRSMVRRQRYDCIVSRAGAELAALTIARETGIPWVPNWNDPFPWDKGPAPYGGGTGFPLAWYWRRFLKAIGDAATWHTFPCERLRRYMIEYLPGATLQRSSVVPHITLEQLVASPQARKRPKLLLAHVGDLRPPRDPSSFLQGLSNFVKQSIVRPSIEIAFMGRNPEGFARRISDMGLEDFVTTYDERPYEESLHLVNEADLAVLIEAPCEEGIFLPNKVVEYVQCGKPIFAVSPKIGTLQDLISKHGGGVVADCAKHSSITTALRQVYESWEAGNLLDDYSPLPLLEEFSEQRVAEALIRTINEAIGSRHPVRPNQVRDPLLEGSRE